MPELRQYSLLEDMDFCMNYDQVATKAQSRDQVATDTNRYDKNPNVPIVLIQAGLGDQ